MLALTTVFFETSSVSTNTNKVFWPFALRSEGGGDLQPRTETPSSARELPFQPNAETAIVDVSWFEEHDASLIECLLDAVQRAGTGVRSSTLKVFDRDL